ncbi:MAG: hypothetical protein KDC92_06195, partial [Bacteroidetes bacterium]|nr:hypothetical protein [Bacteroidota bacterium]
MGWVNSSESDTLSDTVTVDICFVVHDTSLLLDTVHWKLPDSFSIINSSLGGDTTLNPDDTFCFSLQLLKQHSGFPVLPQKMSMRFFNADTTDTSSFLLPVYVFFTPWNTIEIWHEDDFYNCGRQWKWPYHFPNGLPLRQFVHRDSVPNPTFNENDSLWLNWQSEYQVETVAGLPFSIKMAALHPDTIDSFSVYYGDNTYWSDPYDSTSFIVFPVFEGSVTGTLVTQYLNDVGQTVLMPLSGVQVQLRDHDGLFSERLGDKVLTDENGEFTISYSKQQISEGSTLELFLRVTAINTEHDFIVTRVQTNPTWYSVAAFTDIELGDLNPAWGLVDDDEDLDLENVTVNDEALNVAHWTENAYRYTAAQGVGVNPEPLVIVFNTIINNSMFHPGSMFGSEKFWFRGVPTNSLYLPKIRLLPGDRDEGMTYHEWGHFYMWALQQRNYIDVFSWPGNGMQHAWGTEEHSRLAWSEGFCNAIQMILDAVYWEYDQEYGW